MPATPATLALLPFEILSGEPVDESIARGFLYDLSGELARFPNLGVIAADSVLACDLTTVSAVEISDRLGADYLLRGSLRRVGEKLRINVQLLAAKTGQHLWAGRYDEENLPILSDEVVARVANALSIRIDQTMLIDARSRQTTSLEAYECWLRGMEHLQRGTPEDDRLGMKFFQQALVIDPDYARAYAGISLAHFNDWSCQSWERWGDTEKLAYDNAAKADSLDPDDPVVQMILCRIEQYRRQHDRARPRFERALQLAPSDSRILIQASCCVAFDGDLERSLELAERSLDLNPFCPGWYYSYVCMTLYMLERYEDALEMIGRTADAIVIDVPVFQAACHAMLGRHDKAAEYRTQFQEDFRKKIAFGQDFDPAEMFRWVLHMNSFRSQEHMDHLAEGLRRAGFKESSVESTEDESISWPIGNVFRLEGLLWTACYNERIVQLPDLRGFHDLKRLLSQPGEEISSAELADARLYEEGVEQADNTTLQSYRDRLREIVTESEEASAAGNEPRALALEDEREQLLTELRRVTGIGGRKRKKGDAGEKARTAVTWRVRHAIRKLSEAHPSLGKHLSKSVKTGTFCSYLPEHPVEWRV